MIAEGTTPLFKINRLGNKNNKEKSMNIMRKAWQTVLSPEAREFIYFHFRYSKAKAQKHKEILAYLQQTVNVGGGGRP